MKRLLLLAVFAIFVGIGIGIVMLSYDPTVSDADSRNRLWSTWYQTISPDGIEAKATSLANKAAQSSDVTCAESWHRFERENDSLWQILCYDWDGTITATYEVDMNAGAATAVDVSPATLPQ